MSEFSQYKMKKDIREARDFGMMIQALACAKGHLGNAVSASDRWRDHPRVQFALKAMLESPATLDDLMTRKATVAAGTTTDASWAGPLAPSLILASEFVTYMRPLSILGRIPVRKVPFNVKFARITGGASGGFAGQGAPVPVQALSLDTLTLGYSKVVAISAISTELARSDAYDAPGLISADLAAAAGSFLDEAFLDPDRAAVVTVSPASITYGAAQIQSTGLTAAELTADAKSAMRVLDAARIPLSECCWAMTSDVALWLATLTSTTGALVFPDFSLVDGEWLGLPTYVSGSAFGAGSPTEGLIVLLHPQSVAYADDGVASVAVTAETSLALDSAPGSPATLTSLWQANLIGCKITRYCNWILRRSGGVATIRGINL